MSRESPAYPARRGGEGTVPMELFFEIRNGAQVLVCQDRLDEEDALRFATEIHEWSDHLLTAGTTECLTDFEGVTMASSAILRVLLAAAKRVQKHEGCLILANLSPEIAEAFHTSGFDGIFAEHGRLSTSVSAPHPVTREPEECPQLDLVLGAQLVACRDGDTLGTEGTLIADFLAGVPGIPPKQVHFRLADGTWTLIVAEGSNLKTQLDGVGLFPGQSVVLHESHLLQLGKLRLRLRVTPAVEQTAEDDGPDRQVQEYVDMISAVAGRVAKLVCGPPGAGDQSPRTKPENSSLRSRPPGVQVRRPRGPFPDPQNGRRRT